MLISFVLLQACEPEQIGYLNDHLRYGVAQIQVVQGTSVSTDPLIANGSSTPMQVELLEVRNKETGVAVPEFSVDKEFSVYLAEVVAEDVTLEQLSAKIGTSTAPAIDVNQIGGKVTFSPATEDVPPGVYTIDLRVSNISGTKTYKDALEINLISMKPDSLFSATANTSVIGSESTTASMPSGEYTVTVEHRASDENKIIYMWLDKDGEPFNPADGEVIRRAALPSFADWSPFYGEELTDTAIVYEYPYFKGLVYPVKDVVTVGDAEFTDDLVANYRIMGDVVDIGKNINTATTMEFYKPGTHIIRFKLNSVKRSIAKVITITKDVTLPEGAGYTATPVVVDQAELETAFGLPASEIATKLGTDVTYYAIEPDGTLNPNSTAAAPGHWFGADGHTIFWGDGARLFSELNVNDWVFNIGQFPDRNFAGDTFTLKQSLAYNTGSGITRVVFVFNITVE